MDFAIVKKAFRFAWNEIGNRTWIWFKLAIVTALMVVLALSFFVVPFIAIIFFSFPTISAVTSFMKEVGLSGAMPLGVVLWFITLTCLVYLGYYMRITIGSIPARNVLDHFEKKKLRMFENRVTTHKLVLTTLWYGVVVLIGAVLFIIPGIFFAVRYAYAYWIVLEEECGVFEAFSKSWNLTKGNFLPLLVVTVLVKVLDGLKFINILFPISSLVEGSVYYQLKTAKMKK